jgi:hypothetical protein
MRWADTLSDALCLALCAITLLYIVAQLVRAGWLHL